jgi:XRE family aerobic/anaerobic benzoate catabolism transcriptional regulator
VNLQAENVIETDLAETHQFLSQVGSRVRAARTRAGLTRKQLSLACGVSERHLAQVETGKGNISIRLLRQIAAAIQTPLEQLVRQQGDLEEMSLLIDRIGNLDRPEMVELLNQIDQWMADRQSQDKQGRIALIGLKGAGKSTIGSRTAAQLNLPFIELDDEITRESGLSIEEIFALYGEQRYRELEHECLKKMIAESRQFVLAVAGGIVSNLDTFSLLLGSFHTVWLCAAPEEHMGRVMAKGDRRAVEGNPDAMDNLRSLLAARQPLYQRAHHRLETSDKSIAECCKELSDLIQAVAHP